MPERPQVLLADANVLIDYRDSDLSILAMAADHIGPIRVVHAVLEEVKGFDEARAMSIGLEVVDVPTELLLVARGALIREDPIRTARIIAENNPAIERVLQRFLDRIG